MRQHTHKSDYTVWLHGGCVYWNKYIFYVLPYPRSFICCCTCTRRSSSTWTWGSLNAFWDTKSLSVNNYTSQSIKSGRTWLVTRRSSLGKDPDKKFKSSADYESFVKSSQDLDEVWSSKPSFIFPLRRFPPRSTLTTDVYIYENHDLFGFHVGMGIPLIMLPNCLQTFQFI